MQIAGSLVGTAWAAPAQPSDADSGGAALALLVLLVAALAWISLRSAVRSMRARRTTAATGGDFTIYALEALVNAAKIDGRINPAERQAIVQAMREIAGEAFEAARVEAAFATARLGKPDLVDYLAARSGQFSREEKMTLLKALMSVFVADADFDEAEHAALIDYTEAVGFDRQSAPELLRGLVRDVRRGVIV